MFIQYYLKLAQVLLEVVLLYASQKLPVRPSTQGSFSYHEKNLIDGSCSESIASYQESPSFSYVARQTLDVDIPPRLVLPYPLRGWSSLIGNEADPFSILVALLDPFTLEM